MRKLKKVELETLLVETLEALQVYADPSFYHACSFIFDRPTGGFDEDFSPDEFYGREMPGKLARETIDRVRELIGYKDT